MLFTMKITNKNILTLSVLFFTFCLNTFSQSEGLTSSPYSLYGLGVVNQTSIGKSNGLGYTGIGIKTATEINNLNPSNFALIPQNSFFYDIGITGEINNYSNKTNFEGKSNVNFSNLAFAFRIAEGLGAGVSMIPYSDVGYSLLGVSTNIEGSTQTFESTITGLGSLNDLKLNIGYSVLDNLRLGISGSLLFGSIEENESLLVDSSYFELSETTNYTGARLGLGLQYDINDDITFGSIINTPSILKGSVTRYATKTIEGSQVTVEDAENDAADNFELPLEVGIGFSAKLYKSFTVSGDYKKNYWTATNQFENTGKYVDQDIYGIGVEFLKDAKSFKYKDRIRYRLGYNYDNGYLEVNRKKIDGFNLTTGIGIPINMHSNSMINLSYSYGSKGLLDNTLVKENYHLFTLNMSLEDLWFRKAKIN